MRNRQTGRSMIEMLGVLAIVGLLGIGGVWGIGMAFARYKANEIENYVLKCVTTSYTKTMDTFYVGYCQNIFEEPISLPVGLEKIGGVLDVEVTVPSAGECFDPTEGVYGNHCAYLMAQVAVSDRRVMKALVRKNEKIDDVDDVLDLPRNDGQVVIYGKDDDAWKNNNGHFIVAFHFIGSAKDVVRTISR